MPQTEELQGILSTISTDVDEVATNVTSLHEQLQQLQETTPPQVDLTAVIEQARGIRDRLESVSAAIGAPAAGSAQVDQAGEGSDLGGQSGGDDSGTGSADDTLTLGNEGDSSSGDAGGAGEITDEAGANVSEQPGPDQNGADGSGGQADVEQQPA